MAKVQAEVELEEATQEIAAPEAVLMDRQNEIVALYCQLKPGRENTGNKLELGKGGEPYFELKPGQYAKIKRSTAEWHLSKNRTMDASNPLMLRILTLEEVQVMMKNAKKAGVVAPTPPTAEEIKKQEARIALVSRAVKAGILDAKDEKGNAAMTDKDIRELLGEPEPAA